MSLVLKYFCQYIRNMDSFLRSLIVAVQTLAPERLNRYLSRVTCEVAGHPARRALAAMQYVTCLSQVKHSLERGTPAYYVIGRHWMRLFTNAQLLFHISNFFQRVEYLLQLVAVSDSEHRERLRFRTATRLNDNSTRMIWNISELDVIWPEDHQEFMRWTRQIRRYVQRSGMCDEVQLMLSRDNTNHANLRNIVDYLSIHPTRTDDAAFDFYRDTPNNNGLDARYGLIL